MLTDQEIDTALTCAKQELAKKISPSMPMTSIETCLDRNTLLRDYFARAVIAANNAKALADLKPDTHFYDDDMKIDVRSYSADQVAPLIQRVKELEKQVKTESYAGMRFWLGNRRIAYHITEAQIKYEIEPGTALT